jgi:hypothetical protein
MDLILGQAQFQEFLLKCLDHRQGSAHVHVEIGYVSIGIAEDVIDGQ